MSKVLIGSKVEKLLSKLFQKHKGQELDVNKKMDYHQIKHFDLNIELANAVITIKYDSWQISSDMRFKNSDNDEVDFQSELVKYMFKNLKHLMLYNDKIIVSETGFIRYEANKIRLKAIS